MRVFQFLPHIQEGGAESLVRDYSLLMNEKGVDTIIVTIIPTDVTASNVQILNNAGCKILSLCPKRHFFANNKYTARIWNHFFYKREVLNHLEQAIQLYKPDVIHTHLELLDYLYCIKEKLNGVKLFYTCHNEPNIHLSPQTKKAEYRAAYYFIKLGQLQLIALHKEMRIELNSMFSTNNAVVVHNGINFSNFGQIFKSKEEIRRELNIPIDSFVLGHVGRYKEAKNHLFLIDIFNSTYIRNHNAFLLLIGSGPLKSQVEDKISRLNLTSRCLLLENRSDIPSLLKCMDVFVFPSIYEGLPVTLVESQLVNLRNIISDRVTKECFFSERAVPMSIDKSSDEWAEVILNDGIIGNYKNDINSFNIDDVVNTLIALYKKG